MACRARSLKSKQRRYVAEDAQSSVRISKRSVVLSFALSTDTCIVLSTDTCLKRLTPVSPRIMRKQAVRDQGRLRNCGGTRGRRSMQEGRGQNPSDLTNQDNQYQPVGSNHRNERIEMNVSEVSDERMTMHRGLDRRTISQQTDTETWSGIFVLAIREMKGGGERSLLEGIDNPIKVHKRLVAVQRASRSERSFSWLRSQTRKCILYISRSTSAKAS